MRLDPKSSALISYRVPSFPSQQIHHLPLGGAVALNVPLRRLQRGIPRKLLHVAERSSGLDDLLCTSRDERAPAGGRYCNRIAVRQITRAVRSKIFPIFAQSQRLLV
jgi:hypothetical protein